MTKSRLNESLALDEFFEAILLLKNVDECYQFFEDVATVSEIKSLAQRLAVAKMIATGETYTKISKETGASTATISRVKRSLYYGCDGYRIIMERMGIDIVEE